MARPTTYDPAYCDQVIEFLKDGYSLAAFAGEIGVARSTIYEWADNHPEFSDAVKAAQAGSVLAWEKRLRITAMTGDGNATAIIFGLKNRAPDEWRDAKLVGSDPENPLPQAFTVNLVKSDNGDR